jgi:hypothetical protein
MNQDYSSHADYVARVSGDAETRCKEIADAFRAAFRRFIEARTTEVIVFGEIEVRELGRILSRHPAVLKPLLALCNIAARAVERDLGIRNVNTYVPRLSKEHATAIAGYMKPFLPAWVEIGALCHVDRVAFVDKEVRKNKGRWERAIVHALNHFSVQPFVKRRFECGNELFELDAATPADGDVRIGIDVKRIEARRDIHKRADEIVNKASKLKAAHPEASFGAVIYYPFISEHINVENRLRSNAVDAVVFAGESEESVVNAVRMLLAALGAAK